MNDINKVLEQFHNGNLEEASLLAENLLRQKLSNQEHVGLLNILGSIHAIQKEFEKARENFQAALDLDDGNIDTNYNLAKVLTDMNDNSLALKYYEKILKLRNDHAPSFNNMGDIYLGFKNYEKAIKYFSEAIKLEPDYIIAINNLAQAYTNLGFSFQEIGDYKSAIQYYEKALSITPEHANAHNNLSMSLFKIGDIKNGWKHYEYRNSINKDIDNNTKLFNDFIGNKSRWNGEPIQTGLFIWPEQGIGDLIMFAKLFAFLPKNKKIIVCLDDRLIKIFERSFPDLIFVKQSTYKNDLDSKSLDFDYQIPIGSLAKLFLPSYDKLEELEKSYLLPDKEKTSSIRKKIKKENKLIVGVSWKTTNKEYRHDRNIALNSLAEKLNHDQIKLVNLQYGDVSEEILSLKKNNKLSITQVSGVDIFNDIDSFSSLIDACDLVVTIDNSTAHLAGSLGKETYLLLPKISDWRWMLDEDYTPWYKSLKLFRNNSKKNWEEELNKVYKNIHNFLR